MERNLRALALCFVALTSPLAAAGVPEDWPPLPTKIEVPAVGLHPRVLFTAEELPILRARAQTPLGQQFLSTIRWQVDYPGKDLLAKLQAGEAPKGFDPLQASDLALWAATTWLLGEQPEYLDKAKAWMTEWTKAVGEPPTQPVPEISRSLHRLALAYDMLYAELPPEQLALMRAYMAARLNLEANEKAWRTWGWAQGPSFMGRGCDWSAIISGGVVFCCLALESEDPNASPEMLRAGEEVMKWIADYSLNPDGTTPNGNGYASGDFVSYFMALRGLERRGSSLPDHPNLQEMPYWLAYETIPGGYRYDNRNQSGGYLSLSPTLAFLAGHYGGVATWLQEMALGPERRWAGDPGGALAALLYGSFPDAPPPTPDLPLTRYGSNMGTVYSRSGWGADDSCFTLTMEPPGQHHTHPDKGSFTFYSHGQTFAADSGVSIFGAADHNTVLVDGRGQQGGQGVTDAVVRAQVASELADVTWMDVKPAYEQVLAYTDTDGKPDWANLVYGKGLPLYWKQVDSYERVDRYAVYVRGEPGAYVVIVDDVQKDDQPHRYDWVLHSVPPGEIEGQKVTFRSRYGGTYIQSETGEKPVRFTANLPEAGEYNLWVLARPWPDLRQSHWFCTMRVNRQGSDSFYLGHYCNDWHWLSVTHENRTNPRWQLPAGENTLTIGMKRGARIAQVLLAADPDFRPTSVVTEPGPGLVQCEYDPEALAPDWAVSAKPDPRPQMQTVFFQPGAEELELSFATGFKPRAAITQRLLARQETTRAGFAAILLPSDETEVQPEVRTAPQFGQAAIVRGEITDYLHANPAKSQCAPGRVFSDGKFALVRTRGDKILGYVLAGGTLLKFEGQELASSNAGPVFLVNDGQRVELNGPQGARVKAEALGAATQILCNHQPLKTQIQGRALQIAIPVLPKTWKISFSQDDTVCTVTGDGPQPLKIRAPKVINCIVNGVSRYFSRAPGGYIYPKLDVTVPAWGSDPPE